MHEYRLIGSRKQANRQIGSMRVSLYKICFLIIFSRKIVDVGQIDSKKKNSKLIYKIKIFDLVNHFLSVNLVSEINS
jgi:hypothetical protein